MPNKLDKRMSIVALGWPILIEILLRTAIGTSDVFMLSSYSDQAVSAVGVISQFTFFLMIISAFVSSGTGILIAQYLGASNAENARHVAVVSVALSIFVGIALSIIAVFAAIYLLPYYGLEHQVEVYAKEYLLISGAMTFNVTMGLVFSTILRSHGYSRSPMVVNVLSGLLNVVGNYIALYQPFGLPVYGVEGVAIATVISQIIGTVLLWWLLIRCAISLPMKTLFSIPKEIPKKIIKIGAMNAGEVLSYNLAQICIVYFIVQMGTASLTAYTYAQNISRFSFAFALAIGQATQIQTSYYVGKGWLDNIYKKVQGYFVVGFIGSLVSSLIIYLNRDLIIGLFTEQSDIVEMTGILILGSLLLETGRVFNLIFISALKGAGDIQFPVKIGIISMWCLGVFFAYLLGIVSAYGVIGAWLAVALDEWVRGIIMAWRWRSKVWMQFSVHGK